MHALDHWVAQQSRRDASVVRLEDALLGGRWTRYFAYRLRFFFALGVIATLIHALKVVLLLGAFPRADFLAVIVLQAVLAIVGDLWWGGLESMREHIRLMRRRGRGHLAYREIGSWLRLSVYVSAAAVGLAVAWLAAAMVLGGLSAAAWYAAILIGGAGIQLTARTYHSGAYAMRRVYRPLPSLLAVDIATVLALVGLWPLLGIWAFPAAELVAAVAVVLLSIHYTSRTYRGLAIPTLVPLLQKRLPLPSRRAIREAVPPAISYGFVGLESIVVIAAVTLPGDAAGVALVAMLAALGPIVRAGFEWARLLYFDLKRLELPLLAGMRRSFDRAVVALAVVMGAGTWIVAAAVSVTLLGIRQVDVLLALGPFFLCRSVLAWAQMRAFTARGYGRLAAVGALGVVAISVLLVVLASPGDSIERIVALTVVLAASIAGLIASGGRGQPADPVASLSDWLRIVRAVKGPVSVSVLSFDNRVAARGTTMERRRAEEWRRRTVALRLGRRLVARGGAIAWRSRTELLAASPRGDTGVDQALFLGTAGGLLRRVTLSGYESGQVAAVEAARDACHATGSASVAFPGIAAAIGEFQRRFPRGLAFETLGPAHPDVAALPSADRADIFRAALIFCRDLRGSPWPERVDVSALAIDGTLRCVFVVDRRESRAVRRAWRATVRDWTLDAAAGVSRTAFEEAQQQSAISADEGIRPADAGML